VWHTDRGAFTSLGLLRVQINIFICAHGTRGVRDARVIEHAAVRRTMCAHDAPRCFESR